MESNMVMSADPYARIGRAMRAMRRPAAQSGDALYRQYAADQDVYNRTWKPTPYEPRQAEVEQVAEDLGVDLDTARQIIRDVSSGGGDDQSGWQEEGFAISRTYANALSQSPLLANIAETFTKINNPQSWSKPQPAAVTPAPAPRNAPAPVAPSLVAPPAAAMREANNVDARASYGRRGEQQMEMEALANEMAAQLAQDMQQMTPEEVASYQSMMDENARMSAIEQSQEAARAAMENQARLDAMFTQEEGLLGPQRAPAAPPAPEPQSRLAQFSPNINLQMPVEPAVNVASVRQNNIAEMLAEREAQRNAAINAAINAPLEGMRYSAPPMSFAIEDDPQAALEAEMAAQLEQDLQGILGAEMAGARQQEARALEAQAIAEAMAQNEQGMAQRELSNYNEAPQTITPPAPTEVTRSFSPATYQEPNMPTAVSPADRARAVAAAEQAEIDALTAAMAQNELGIAPPNIAYASWNEFDPALEGAPGATPARGQPAGLADLNDVTDVSEMDVPGPAMSLGELAAAIAASQEMDDTPPSFQNEMESLNDVQNNPPAMSAFSSLPLASQSFAPETASLASIDPAVRELEQAAVPAPEETGYLRLSPEEEAQIEQAPVENFNVDRIAQEAAQFAEENGLTNEQRGQMAKRALAARVGLNPNTVQVRELTAAIDRALAEGRITPAEVREIQSKVDQAVGFKPNVADPPTTARRTNRAPQAAQETEPEAAAPQRVGPQSSLMEGLGVLGQVLADLNPFGVSPAQAESMQAPRQQERPQFFPPVAPPPPVIQMPQELVEQARRNRARTPIDQETLDPGMFDPAPAVGAPSMSSSLGDIGPGPGPSPSSSGFTSTPGGSFRSAQDVGIDPEGDPSRSTPERGVTAEPGPTTAPAVSAPAAVAGTGVASPDAAPNADEGGKESGSTGPSVASPSFGAGIGIGNSPVGETPSYGMQNEMESLNESFSPDDVPSNLNPEMMALSFAPLGVNVAAPPSVTTLGDIAASRTATARGAQEVGMEALNSSLASLASSYASPVSMSSAYGMQSEDTTEADPDGGMPGGQAPSTGVTGMDAATAAGFGTDQSQSQDGPGTDTSSTSGDGGGDPSSGGSGGSDASDPGSWGGGDWGGGDTGGWGGSGTSDSSSYGGSSPGSDFGGHSSTSDFGGAGDVSGDDGSDWANGGLVKAPRHYQAIIERAFRAARRSRAA